MGMCRRHYATSPTSICKNSYEEILISAKRKHSDRFFIFCDIISGEKWYSEGGISIYGDEIEIWEKRDKKWIKL